MIELACPRIYWFILNTENVGEISLIPDKSWSYIHCHKFGIFSKTSLPRRCLYKRFCQNWYSFPKKSLPWRCLSKRFCPKKIHISEQKLKLPLRCLSKMFCQTKTTLSQQKVCCKGANLRGFVNTKILLQKPMPRTCQSKRLCQQQDASSKKNAANVPIYRAAPVACFSCFWYSNCVMFEGNTIGNSISLGTLA